MLRNEEYGVDWSWHDANGLSRVVNVSGTMTALGGSVTTKRVAEATAAAMPRFAKIHELQAQASETIARLTGAEAGFLTASASAGISLSVAGCLTGLDPAKVEALPEGAGPDNGVAVQMGHLCEYGAPVSQAITLVGGKVHVFGQSTQTRDYQLEAALEGAAAALYVVSHHVVDYGMMPLETFIKIAHAKGVPVIVDAASEYDLTGMIAKGADIAIYSGHKFMGGPTSGIVAGRKDLVRAAYLQNIGIGRGMKIGKESIAGSIAAMEQWLERDHAAIRARETEALQMWSEAVADLPGITAKALPDPTDNPLERLRVWVDPAVAGASAAQFAVAFGRQDPPIVVRGHEVEKGYFDLDPCNLTDGQAALVRDALTRVLSDKSAVEIDEAAAHDDVRNGGTESYLNWLS
ncbi:aminotransferase class V-fold PLP-dependent enzyme [Pelagovum pacificum]|uniref:Aminotransferase class V-fold PLP-dependent enzyme n=1 Tax=Pelagovum pacificum TaxID=2588711 RepID=A0A5C5GF06_9RHOB|nr:aminotransferase class V-fold PLP-dependent enzyme [Pelagovum pacificum]QQA43528.1 aminotransferase class V-fold PLP-dependent enzyme [Pelagovum pacificum]TNY33335.1 aminotransferase class V-fold PLP-dependent enzyme [Pelagovum pacificum]